jgi:hypothetical protein
VTNILENNMEQMTEACWEGYKQVGMKKLNGKMVPNCVPVTERIRTKLDNPNQQDSDVNNDGKVDATDDYLRKRRELSKRYKTAKSAGVSTVNTSNLDKSINELNEGEFCPRCLAMEILRAHGQPLQEAEYHGRKVPLGKPMRGDVKKFKVFVKDPSTGNVKKVNFGDPNMRIKKSNPARRKSFRARHNCDNPGPRTKARYWSCRKW